MKLYDINDRQKYSFNCIYLWTNLVNGKKYVGQTKCFYNRMSQYKLGHFNKYMSNAITKYGLSNFDISILERDIEVESLDEREQYWMDYYQSYNQNYGYNICQFASSVRGYKHTAETRRKLSDIATARMQDPTERAKLQGENNGMYGKKHDDKWRKGHSEWLKNKWATDEEYRKFWHERMSGEKNYFYGKDFSGDRNGHAKSIRCVEKNKIYTTVKEAAKENNTSRQNISHVLNGRQETAGGYHWEYV